MLSLQKRKIFRILEISSIFVGVIMALYYFYPVFASPPGSMYAPGETTDPTCSPGDANCSVYPPLVTTLTTSTAITMATHTLQFAYSSSSYTALSVAADGALTVSSTGGVTTTFVNKISVLANSYFATIASGTWNGSVIGIAYGGTNSSTIAANGSVIYSDGTRYNASAVGTSGQVLISGGSGVPTWTNTSTMGFVNLQGVTSGTLQTGNFNISGTGLVGTAFGVNTTSPIASLAVQGIGGTNLFEIASSTGASLFRILQNGVIQVNGSTNGDAGINIAGGGLYTNTGQIRSDAAGTAIYAGNGQIRADGATAAFNAPNGNITVAGTGQNYFLGTTGIGTTSVSNVLTVQGSGTKNPFSITTNTAAAGSMLAVLTNGNVGVNSSTPLSILAVQGVAGNTPIFDVASSTGASILRVLANGSIAINIGTNTTTVNSSSLYISQIAATTGTPQILTLVGAAHTALYGGEDTDVLFDLSATKTFFPGTGNQTIATNRDFRIRARTYNKDDGTNALSFTDAATVSISGPPTGGTGVTFGKTAAALRIESGQIMVPIGSATAPSYALLGGAGTLNAGLYTTQNDDIDFTTAGVARGFIDSAGFNAGLPGTSNLTKFGLNAITQSNAVPLTIQGGLIASNAGTDIILNTVVARTAGNLFSVQNFGATTTVVNYLGQMGINSSTPLAMLSIVGTTTKDLLIIASSTGADLFHILTNGRVGINSSSPIASFAVQGSGTQNPLSINSSTGASMLSILTNGNVGIGVAVPTQALSLAGSYYTSAGQFISAFNNQQTVVLNGGTAAGIVVGAGTAAAPTFSFSGNMNVGMYAGGTNILKFSTASTDRLTITAAGMIGIATTTPAARLEIWGSGITSSTLTFNTFSQGGTSTFKIDDAGNASFTNDGLYYEASSSVSYINSLETGAINFDDDAGMVSWVDMTASSTVAGTSMSYTAFLDGNPMIQVYGDSDGVGGVTNLTVSIATSTTSTARLFVVGSGSNNIVDFASSTGASALRITAGGNVGINTNTPVANLSLQGFAGSDVLEIASSTGASLLRILTNGNVGINSSTPVSQFAVNGTTTLTRVLGFNGSATNPVYSFFNDNDTGLYWTTAGLINVATDGLLAAQIGSSGGYIVIATAGGGVVNRPPFTKTDDLDTGMWFPGGDQLALSTAGATRIYMGATGNVGINSSTPMNTFSVQGKVSILGLDVNIAGNGVCVTATGTITDAGAAACVPSALQFKTNVTPYTDSAVGLFKKIVDAGAIDNYERKDKSGQRKGLIADYVANVDPTLVVYNNGEVWSLNFEDFTGLAVKAITELNDKIAQTYPVGPECDSAGNCAQTGDVVCSREDASSSTVFIEQCSATSTDSIIGVVSGNLTTSSRAVALGGRAPVNVSTANGPIKAGDYLTSSAIPGVAVKALEPGKAIGMALQSFDGVSPTHPYPAQAGNTTGTIMIFVNTSWSLGSPATSTIAEESIFPDFAKVILDKFTLVVKNSLRKLGLLIKDGIATVKEVFADKVNTNQLCVGNTCINEQQLQDILSKTQTQAAPADVVTESPIVTTTPPIVPTTTTSVVIPVETGIQSSSTLDVTIPAEPVTVIVETTTL